MALTEILTSGPRFCCDNGPGEPGGHWVDEGVECHGSIPVPEPGKRHGIDSVRVTIEPPGYDRSGASIRWHFRNWKPSVDFRFTYDEYSEQP